MQASPDASGLKLVLPVLLVLLLEQVLEPVKPESGSCEPVINYPGSAL